MRTLKLVACAAVLIGGLSACAPMQNGIMRVVEAMPGGEASDDDLKAATAQKLNIDSGRIAISNRHTPAMMRLAWTATVDGSRTYGCSGYYNMGNVDGVNCQ